MHTETHTLPARSLTRRPSLAIATAVAALSALLLLVASAARADHAINTSDGMTLEGAPLAIHGYDPVAFFTEGKARRGDARFASVQTGGTFRFVSAENKAAFDADPNRYLPQYGGFCAYGVSVGVKFDGDPQVFEIVDGKLYFNLDPKIQATWKQDLRANLRKADDNWRRIRDVAPTDIK